MSRRRRKYTILGQFRWQLIEMLESPAYRCLSLSARRVIDRLDIELGHHGGTQNGSLPVTYSDFREFGIDHQAVAPAIREAVALGFVEVTERGRAGNAEYRTPSRYRITYRETERADPTNEWKLIKSIEDAEMIKSVARKASEKQKPRVGKPRVSVGETHTERAAAPVGETHTTVSVGKTHTTSISRGGDRDAA